MADVTPTRGGCPKVLHEGADEAAVERTSAARRWWPVSLFLLVCSGLALSAPGDTPEATYRANVAEVRLTFTATDQNNHSVATLQAGDFAVVDRDIVVRDFQSFTRSGWTKLHVVVLIDTSESVTPRLRQEITDILQVISPDAGIPEEDLSLVSFHGIKPNLICAGNCRASGALDQLPAVEAGGLTPLFDSVVYAAALFAQPGEPDARKVLILFSDGEDTISRHSAADAMESAMASELRIYAVGLKNAAYPSPGSAVLENLARATGGRFFAAPEGTSKVLDAVLEDVHATFTVTYKPPSRAAGFHPVRILPTHDLNLQFRCRRGYYYSRGR
jgi:Ca-activated chloride channel family protein